MPEHPLSTLTRLDKDLMARMKADDDWAFADGALPRRVKLLMALVYDAAHGAGNGVAALARQALDAGATREEIAEALRVAFVLSGVGSLYTASQALRDLFPATSSAT